MNLKRRKRDDETGAEIWRYEYQGQRMYVFRFNLDEGNWRVARAKGDYLYTTPSFHKALDVAEDLLRSTVTNSL